MELWIIYDDRVEMISSLYTRVHILWSSVQLHGFTLQNLLELISYSQAGSWGQYRWVHSLGINHILHALNTSGINSLALLIEVP